MNSQYVVPGERAFMLPGVRSPSVFAAVSERPIDVTSVIRPVVVPCRYRRAPVLAGRVVRAERAEMIGELREVPLAGALVATDAAHVWVLATVKPLRKKGREKSRGAAWKRLA